MFKFTLWGHKAINNYILFECHLLEKYASQYVPTIIHLVNKYVSCQILDDYPNEKHASCEGLIKCLHWPRNVDI